MQQRSLASRTARVRPSARHRPEAQPYRVEALESRLLLAAAAPAYGTAVTSSINISEFPIQATALGDVNGDTIPDLIVGDQNGETELFLGSNTGTFAPSTAIAPGGEDLALGTFLNTDNLDLATALGVLPGNGNGTFGAAKAGFTLPTGAVAFYADDFNGDSNMDLAVATYTPATSTTTSASIGITVFLGNGDGTFIAPVSTPLFSSTTLTQNFARFAFDDFNGDGIQDLLTPFGVFLGNGNGTFKTPAIPFPFSAGGSTGSSTSTVLPAAPLFAIGDFNGDGMDDVAIIPPSGNTGQVEILLGQGTGAFTDNGPVTLGTGLEVTALDTEDVNGDGNLDLLAGVQSSGTSPELLIATNGGGTVFSAPATFALPGPAVSITSADISGGANPDLVVISSTIGSDPATTLAPPSTVSVFLSGAASTQTVPVVGLTSTKARVVQGATLTYIAGVQPPPRATSRVEPTGTVTFMDGATSLGMVPLNKAGRATLVVTAAGLGLQQITALYSGDGNYGTATSATFNETVLLSTTGTPLLVPALASVTLPALFLPRDSATVSITLTNGGSGPANGRLAIQCYLSADGQIDSSAIPVTVPAFVNHAILIGSGRSMTISGRFTPGTLAVGSYFLVAQLVPISGLIADELSAATLVSSMSFQAAGLVFGTIGSHRGVTLAIADVNGVAATFSLSGPGMGTITQTNGVTNLELDGTTGASRLLITSHGSLFSLDTVTIRGSVGGINAPHVLLTTSLDAPRGIGNVMLGGVGTGSAAATFSLGAGSTTLNLGTVQLLTVQSAASLSSIIASTWAGGTIVAPSVGALTVHGDMSANVQIENGGLIRSAQLGSVSGGTWTASGGIGTLHINGNATNLSLYAGADAGRDQILGTNDDRYGAAVITTLFVGGSVNATLIAAGASPLPGGTIFNGLTLIPGGAIHSIIVRGTLSSDSQILAALLPARASIDGAVVSPATLPNFQL